MHLERLELRGFKSFRDKTTIEFPDRFTAIVGPNGSGKSNLTEAVCFVLGKSRGLRANVLQDLIFNGGIGGTPSTKTVVSITLTDDDGKTYKISRMVDKEGRSLYKLNDNRVTRDKIMDIAGDNEYNIILQDDVTKVIEMKPTERRVIIDDLCGIAEYDKKKVKAVKELEKVEDKISDTHIVLGEKQSYLIRLRKERDDALKYKSVKDELSSNKGSLIHHSILRVEKRVERLDEKAAEIGGEKQEHALKIKGLREKIQVEREALKEIGKKILALEEGKSRVRYTELSSDIRGIEERINALSEREASVSSELGEYSGKRRELAGHVNSIDLELPRITAEIEKLEKEILKESAKVADPKLEKEVSEAQTTVLELKSRENSLRESIEERTQSISRKEIDEEELRREIDLTQTERVETVKHIAEFEESYRVKEREYTRLRESLGKNKTELERIDKKLEEAQLTEARKKTQLKTIEEAGGGVKGAVKAVMRLKDVLPGIHGTVSQLGAVADEKYEVALQVAAGGRLQSIVVDDVKVAGKCIDYLKKKQVGRATFLPLDKISVGTQKNLPDGAIGFARDKIKTEAQYRKVFDYVFGDTVIVKDLKSAEKLGVGEIRMVTPDGELLEKSGAITGGHISKTVEIGFSNLEELEKEIEKLGIDIARLTEQRENLLADIVQFEAKLMDYGKLVDEKTEVERYRVEQKRVDERITELKKRAKKAADEKKEIQDKIAGAESKLSSCESERKACEKVLTRLMDERGKHDTHLVDELKSKETELKVRRSSLTEKKRSADEQLSELDVRVTRLSEEKEGITEAKAYKKKELENLVEELRIVEAEATTLGDEIKSLLQMREKNEAKIVDLSADVSSNEFTANELAEKISQVLIEKAKAETELEALKDDFTEYAEVEIIDTPVKNIERNIMTLERQLEEFGSINMKAIEAFDQAQGEYDEIQGKLNTLKAERQSIFDFMEQVERKKHEVFMKAFTTVKENFEDIFTKLSDGVGTLILDKPTEISESGLLIKASPGGKKIMNLDAMSGGEKVLTSSAFLLAIQQYKPAFFYIVDELDAALDKKNSVRLAAMLKEQDAQFILVTHNNAIIKYAESVVGVSMQNAVSNIVEVKLEG
ncbi:MAG: chromosome segregation protein SMC [Candidatus Altiarchaeota archaeon]